MTIAALVLGIIALLLGIRSQYYKDTWETEKHRHINTKTRLHLQIEQTQAYEGYYSEAIQDRAKAQIRANEAEELLRYTKKELEAALARLSRKPKPKITVEPDTKDFKKRLEEGLQ